jgi:hypothetical protein
MLNHTTIGFYISPIFAIKIRDKRITVYRNRLKFDQLFLYVESDVGQYVAMPDDRHRYFIGWTVCGVRQ